MKSKTLLKICVVIFLCFYSEESYAAIVKFSLSHLIHDSNTIAVGEISLENDKIILNVEKILKGKQHGRLIVLFQPWWELPDPKFVNEEAVLLFLEAPDVDGKALLRGLGDQAKWPRVYPEKPEKHAFYRHFPKLQDNASLGEIHYVVEKLLRIEKTSDPNEKVKLCKSYIKSPNRLLQYTAMEYASEWYFWPPQKEHHSKISYEITRKRFNIMRNLSNEVLPLVDSNEPSLRAQSIYLLRYAYPDVMMPILIRKITDDDKLVRYATRVVLGTMSGEFNIKESFANYKHDTSTEHLKSIQRQWSEWWEKNKGRFKRK